MHDVVTDGPCLMCFLPPRVGTSVAEEISRRFGLSLERLGRGDDPLLEEEIAGLDRTAQDVLRPHVGKPVCSLADGLGLAGDATGYQPAVPFIAQQAACLAVGRMLSTELRIAPGCNLVQYDGLIGPEYGLEERRQVVRDCYCQQRR